MDTRKKNLLCILGAGVIVLAVVNLLAYKYWSILARIGDTSGRTEGNNLQLKIFR